MRAEELMIGDWLFYRGQFNAFPFKVEQIMKKKVGYHAEPNETRMHYLRLCECNPIPLTPEILEKNKISKSRLMGEQRHFTYYLDSCLELLAIYDADFSFQIGSCARYIKYVHELRHVLRLCKINKEIEL